MLTPSDLSFMRAVQQSTMDDTCNLMIASSGSVVNAYGYLPVSFASSGSSECGLEILNTDENLNNEAAWYDARLRLPVDTNVDNLDRIQVTHRYGEALSPALDFMIVGNPMRGPSGLVLKLRTLTNG